MGPPSSSVVGGGGNAYYSLSAAAAASLSLADSDHPSHPSAALASGYGGGAPPGGGLRMATAPPTMAARGGPGAQRAVKTEQERMAAHRARNCAHARVARVRQKEHVEELRATAEALREARAREARADAARDERDCRARLAQWSTLHAVLRARADGEKAPRVWADLLDGDRWVRASPRESCGGWVRFWGRSGFCGGGRFRRRSAALRRGESRVLDGGALAERVSARRASVSRT